MGSGHLQEILHLSPIQAGLVYLPGTFLIFLVSGISAQLVNKVPPSVLVITGLMLVAAGLGLILLADANSSWTALMPAVLLCSLGTGLFNPAVVAIALGSVSEQQSGLAAGTNDAFRQGGIAVGVAVFGAVVPAASALGKGSPANYVTGMHHAAIIAAAVAGIGAITCARLFRVSLASSSKQLAEAAVVITNR
jgi:fucose permease